jgi:centromeric protein E
MPTNIYIVDFFFYSDFIFNENDTTQKLFESLAKPIVELTLKGINGTIFAYGQTSTGKTHTMVGNEDEPGIIILAVREIFKEIGASTDREFLIR